MVCFTIAAHKLVTICFKVNYMPSDSHTNTVTLWPTCRSAQNAMRVASSFLLIADQKSQSPAKLSHFSSANFHQALSTSGIFRSMPVFYN